MTQRFSRVALSFMLLTLLACGGPTKQRRAEGPKNLDPERKEKLRQELRDKTDASAASLPSDDPKTNSDPAKDPKTSSDPAEDPEADLKEKETKTGAKDDEVERQRRQATTDPTPVEVLSKPLEWIDDAGSSVALENRFAVLVGANEYNEQSWNIPFAIRNLKVLRSALNRFSGIPEKSITAISGIEANKSAIESYILKIAQRTGPGKALLIFYFTGHGYVDSNGTPYFFTHYTRELNGQYKNVVSQSDLALWFSRAKTEAKKEGCQLEIVTIFDACRVAVLAPPPKAVLRGAQNWEIFSTQAGRFAQAPSNNNASPFTRAFVESLQKLAGLSRNATINTVFQETSRRTKELTNGKQVPEMRRGSSAAQPDLVVPNRISFGVRVVDATQGTNLKSSKVAVGNTIPLTNTGTVKVQTRAGKHWVRISAKGYLTRREEVSFDLSHQGKTLFVTLPPEVVIVRGRISPPGVVEAKVQGIPQTIRPKYHTMKRISSSNGVFELRLPGLKAGAELVLVRGTRELKRLSLPKEPFFYVRDPQNIYERIGVVDFGRISVGEGNTKSSSEILAAEKRLIELRGRTLLPLPMSVTRPKITESPLKDPAGQATFVDAMKWIAKKKYEVARNRLRILAKRSSNVLIAQWLAWVEIEQAIVSSDPAYCRRRLNQLKGGNSSVSLGLRIVLASHLLKRARSQAKKGDASAFEWFTEVEALTPAGTGEYTNLIHSKSRDLEILIAATLVRQLADSKRWKDVFEVFKKADKSSLVGQAQWIKIGREVLPQALKSLLVNGLKRGKFDGDWSVVDLALAYYRSPSSRKWSFRQAALHDLVIEAERERLPKETRMYYRQAKAAFSAGKMETAYGLYLAAREKANTYYMGLIDSQIRYLQPRLYSSFLNEGGQFEAEGKPGKAAESYLKARRYDFRAKDALEQLLEVHSLRGNPTLAAAVKRYKREFASEDSRLTILIKKGSVAGWLGYLRDFPKGSARPQAWNALRIFKTRLALKVAQSKNTRQAWENYLNALWPSERPTVTVAKSGGDFKTVSAALEKAADGTRIVVEPGVYKDRIIITRPVEIVGKGDASKIVLVYGNVPTISVRTPYATISNLTIRTVGVIEEGRKPFCTVDINQGNFVMTTCILESNSKAAIGIHNKEAKPLISRCIFRNCESVGAFVYRQGAGSIVNCYFYDCRIAAVAVTTAANPTVRKCRFFNGTTAIAVYTGGFGVFEGCTSTKTENTAIMVMSKSNAQFRSCKVLDSEAGGVLGFKDSRATFVNCEIKETASSGVEVRDNAQFVFEGCTIRNSQANGAYIHSNGYAQFKYSRLYKNQKSGIEVLRKGRISVTNSLISGNGILGVSVSESGQATVRNCDLRRNREGWIMLDKSSLVSQSNNKK
jgi:hypothetical protein